MKTAAITSLLFTFLGFTFDLTPNVPLLLVSVLIGMVIDFATGVIKAKFKKQERTSEGYRRTVKKVTQYFTAIALSLGIQYLVKRTVSNATTDLQYISVFVCVFVLYIEITSILENLYEIDNRSMMARFLIRPLLVIMKFGLERNPIIKAEDQLLSDNNNNSNTE